MKETEQKQIEELAKVIDDRMLEARGYLGSMNKGQGHWIAESLVTLGYQNCKGKVVLTKEEYDELLSRETRAFIKGEKQACKEIRQQTIIEIINLIESLKVPEDGIHEWRDDYNKTIDRIILRINARCLINGVEVEENER